MIFIQVIEFSGNC